MSNYTNYQKGQCKLYCKKTVASSPEKMTGEMHGIYGSKILNISEVAKHFDNVTFSFPSFAIIENYKELYLVGLCDNLLK